MSSKFPKSQYPDVGALSRNHLLRSSHGTLQTTSFLSESCSVDKADAFDRQKLDDCCFRDCYGNDYILGCTAQSERFRHSLLIGARSCGDVLGQHLQLIHHFAQYPFQVIEPLGVLVLLDAPMLLSEMIPTFVVFQFEIDWNGWHRWSPKALGLGLGARIGTCWKVSSLWFFGVL